MRMRLQAAALLAIASALAAGSGTPAAATTPATTWTPDLSAGEQAGIGVAAGSATLARTGTFLTPVEDGGATEGGPSVPTGLLTLPARSLDAATDTIGAATVGDVPEGTTATVDVRARRSTGGWTEWIPATATAGGAVATLPEPSSEVQGRLVLTGASDVVTTPSISGVTLTARRSGRARSEARTEQAPLNYRVFATREGLVGGTTANGHVIADRDHFVALPSRRALAPRNTGDYSVKVCAPNGRCAFAPVWDVGPWNTRDDYWNPSPQRANWADLTQGVPQAQAAFKNGHNGGKDQFDRKVLNPAGIDLGDGLFWDALGLKNNSWVTVDYLWTGSVRLSKVAADAPVNVMAAPDAAAAVVGIAAERAAVPVQCAITSTAGRWLRIGVDQYLDAGAVPRLGPVEACHAAAG